MSGHGKFIYEKMLQVSKDETEYFNNSKIYTKEDPKTSPYKKQIPTYLRMLENPRKLSLWLNVLEYQKSPEN